MNVIRPVLIGVALALSAAGAHAQIESSRPVALEIKSQVLRDALNDWAQQTGLQLISPSSAILGILVSPAVAGTLSPRSALEKLLEGTSLTCDWLDHRTVVIRQHETPGPQADRAGPPPVVPLAGHGESSAVKDEQTEAEPLSVEEIIVTAQRRAEPLRKVPISITVLKGDALDSSSRLGAWDALADVPAMAVFAGGNFDVSSLNVRGVSAVALFNGSTPVAFYLDAIPFAFVFSALVPDAGVYDLERIEVLRGPQGTLYGANALNGVVRVLTHDADLDEFGLKARASVSTTNGGDQNYRSDAVINVPIIEDKLAVRGVAGYQDLSGWIDTPARENANDSTRKNFRLKVNAAPTSKLKVGLSGWWSRTQAGSTNSSTANYTRINEAAEPQTNDFDAYGAVIAYDFGIARLASSTSKLTFDLSSILDFEPYCVTCGPFASRMEAKVFAEEITLNSTSEGPWRWTVGGMYRDAEDRLSQDFVNSVPPATDFAWNSRSAAVFGELTREFADGRWDLTGGLRYFRDEVSLHENRRSDSSGPLGLISSGRTFEKVTPRIVLAWHPLERSTVYASYAQGFRSGLEQNPIITRRSGGALPSTRPDVLASYELGVKSSVADGIAEIEAAIFYLDWNDVQQTVGVPIPNSEVGAVLNGGSASGLGAEATMTWRPVAGLSIAVNMSWNALEFDDDPRPGTISVFRRGDRIRESPEYMAGGSIDYVFPIGASSRGHLSTSVSYRGSYSNKDTPTTSLHADSRFIARAEAGVTLSEAWDVDIYIDNLTDNYAGTEIDSALTSWTARPRPRTYGLQVEYRF